MLVGSRNVKSRRSREGDGEKASRIEISSGRYLAGAEDCTRVGIFFQARKEGSEIGDGWIALSRSDCGPRYWEYK